MLEFAISQKPQLAYTYLKEYEELVDGNQPASCGLVVNILLSVFAGNGLTVVAVSLRFDRDGVLYGFGSELVNGIVLLAVLLCQLLLQGFDLFLLLFKLCLRIVFAGGKGESGERG